MVSINCLWARAATAARWRIHAEDISTGQGSSCAPISPHNTHPQTCKTFNSQHLRKQNKRKHSQKQIESLAFLQVDTRSSWTVADLGFPRWESGHQLLGFWRKPIIWEGFSGKMHENERNWTEEASFPGIPSWICQCWRFFHTCAGSFLLFWYWMTTVEWTH